MRLPFAGRNPRKGRIERGHSTFRLEFEWCIAAQDAVGFHALHGIDKQCAAGQDEPGPKKISDAVLRTDAYALARLPLEKANQCPEDLLNRILWHAMKGPRAPYPACATPGRSDD